MTRPSGSALSILRRYCSSYSSIVSFERGDYARRSTGYTHCLREVVLRCLLVVSDCEVAKITVHAHRGGAFYCGNIAGDREAEPVMGQSERTHLDLWLRDDVYRVLGQRYAETLPSCDWNL